MPEIKFYDISDEFILEKLLKISFNLMPTIFDGAVNYYGDKPRGFKPESRSR